MRLCRVGLRKSLGWDALRRRYWALGGAAGAWRVYVEEDDGKRWGWYDGKGSLLTLACFTQSHVSRPAMCEIVLNLKRSSSQRDPWKGLHTSQSPCWSIAAYTCLCWSVPHHVSVPSSCISACRR